ncbi:unnamed protein product [Caenorhabditis angaria]|uniref:DZF domain-containing protein n=1 Tax=Caenorhabditis angaria TaxID=860376 RepID=A0A9P1I4Q0_9PELO|nr:unnamed protein product [Caenorhabditis angaria]
MYSYQGAYGGYVNPPQYQSTNAAATASLYQQHQQQTAAAASIYGTGAATTAPATNVYQSFPYSAAAAAGVANQQSRLTTDAYNTQYGGYPSNSSTQHYYGTTGGVKNVSTFGAAAAAAAQTPSYSTYDAAVYAAASTYIANKKSTTTSTATTNPYAWMNSSNSVNNKPYWSNKRKYDGSERDSTMHYCEICKISCAGTGTYKEHLEGKQHKRKESLQKGDQPITLARNKVSYRCDLCNVTCAGHDTYLSHIRGKQHMKAVALCRKMGKVVPEDVPTIISKNSSGEIQEVKAKSKWHQQQLPGTNKVIGINTINFVGGSRLNTTGRLEEKKKEVLSAVGSVGISVKEPVIEVDDERLQAMIVADDIKPIGEEHVKAERDPTGKLINYLCTICDCKFSDPNAKDVHLKGRRHRLSYQKKVDPSFRVDTKQPSKKSRENNKEAKTNVQRGPWFGGVTAEGQRLNVLDERHFEEKHGLLHPGEEYVFKLEKFILETEKVLKSVSEDVETNRVLFEQTKNIDEGEIESEENKPTNTRILQGVMRVGLYAKNIFIKGDDLIELVVVSTPIPTTELVQYIKQSFGTHTQLLSIENDEASDASLIIKHPEIENVRIRVFLTSPTLREIADDSEIACADHKSCLTALSYLRRAKWFAARCLPLKSCQPVLRVFRELRKRSAVWGYLNDHTIELLVEKILSSYPCPLSPADGFKTILEAISVGLVCTGILYDPCEKEQINIFDSMSEEQKLEVTSTAQTALRLIAFNQMYQVLSMTRLSDIRPSLMRKRQNDDQNGNNEDNNKKEKIEDEEEEEEMEKDENEENKEEEMAEN